MKIIKEIKTKKEIEELENYKNDAGPKKTDQWKDDHSAKEFAKKVVDGSFERDMKELFGENLVIDEVYPEKEVYFDAYGEGRHHDLACVAKLNGKKIAVCVEAKATESFGDKTTGVYYNEQKNDKKNVSNVPNRIEMICKLLWDNEQLDEQIKNIEYQLLTAMAGTVAYGYQNKVSKLYFVVYQLETDKTTKEQIISHKEAINNFLLKFGINEKIENNKIVKLKKDKEWYLTYLQRKKSRSE